MIKDLIADRLEALKAIAALKELPQATRRRIAQCAGLQGIGAGTVLFRRGERPHYVYGILEGRVALSGGTGVDENIIDFPGPGDLVPLPPALLGLPSAISATATSEVRALLIPIDEFTRLIEADAPFAAAVARVMAAQWRQLLRQLKQLKTDDADVRLAAFLIEHAGKTKGRAKLRLPSSKRQLASRLGISPETLSRALGRLRPLGIRTDGDVVEIDSLERLAAALRDGGALDAQKAT